MRWLLLLLLWAHSATAQQPVVSGRVVDTAGKPVANAIVAASWVGVSTDSAGLFALQLAPGRYTLHIVHTGFVPYNSDTFSVLAATHLPTITLVPAIHLLAEVTVAEKIVPVRQNGDTTEFDARAFAVPPDADAAALVRRMPGFTEDGTNIKVEGEEVIKIVVDGQVFFGTDPYAVLRTLPADMVAKVQVYNERSEQEQFNGMKAGATTKTINIVTRPERRKGLFGDAWAGGGGAADDARYATGASVNVFNNNRRMTIAAGTNNVAGQDLSAPSARSGGGGEGLAVNRDARANYIDKWGKKADINASYSVASSSKQTVRQVQRSIGLSAGTGQQYTELATNGRDANSHRMNVRMTYNIDSLTSLVIMPQAAWQASNNTVQRGGTTTQDGLLLNTTSNSNGQQQASLTADCTAILRRKFNRKGRTLQLTLAGNTGNNNTDGSLLARNAFYAGAATGDTTNQRNENNTATLRTSASVVYTEPVDSNNMLSITGNWAANTQTSDRNTLDFDEGSSSYSIVNQQLSNAFATGNTTAELGADWQYNRRAVNLSLGCDARYALMSNEQSQPALPAASYTYRNLMPRLSLTWHMAKKQELTMRYSTTAQLPSVSQLQNVVNNSNPLHLSTGNPGLRQPYRHNIMLRFHSSLAEGKGILSGTVTGATTRDHITNNTIAATRDTLVGGINLPAGAQLTLPVNIAGNRSINGNMYYSTEVKVLQCRVTFSVNGALGALPSVINSRQSVQHTRTGGGEISISGRLQKVVDVSMDVGTNIVNNTNGLNASLNTNYMSHYIRANINYTGKLWFAGTSVRYQGNAGIAAGFNRAFTVWNAEVGRKFLKDNRGEIRIVAYDLLNQNDNIQHTVTDTYIQDTRTNLLRRYALLVFTYRLRNFAGK